MSWRRLSVGMAMVAALALGPGAAAGASPRPTIETEEVTFTITWEQCSQLAEGSTIDGEGTLTTVTHERARSNGATRIDREETAFGTATDQDGNSYIWSYDNHSRVSSSAADPTAFAGVMRDRFWVLGSGPERIDTGFFADYSYGADDPENGSIVPWHEWGDPVDWEAGTLACDPI